MARTKDGLEAGIEKIRALREEFWADVSIPGSSADLNTSLEKALRLANFLELAELFARDALARDESAGGHFREEWQTEEGEAKRDDENFSHASAWEFTGVGEIPEMHIEPLSFEYVKLTQRSYK
jgi:succinate dehydrogenase / fumarate reductase flavoprotein subunit